MESLGAKTWSANRQLLDGFGPFFSVPVLAKFSRYKGWEVFLSRIWTFISSYWPRFFIRYFCAVLAPRLCSKSVIEYRRLYFESLGHIWKVLENLYRKNVLCVNLGKNPYRAKNLGNWKLHIPKIVEKSLGVLYTIFWQLEVTVGFGMQLGLGLA